MTRFEQVRKAMRFQSPDYVPILFFNRDKEQSDIQIIDVVQHFQGEHQDTSEWGFVWESFDQTMGQPKEALIRQWADLDELKLPDPSDKTRFAGAQEIMDRYPGCYYLASLVLSGFTIMTFLRGFAGTLEDLYEEPEQLERLADLVFGFENAIIGQLREQGFHGVAFYDDWGTQNNLIISPAMWRAVFKPRYRQQFDLVHENGLDVYFHSCGAIQEIIPDLIEIGVDMLNLSQPNLFNIEELGRLYGGKVCFVCPVSYQTTAISGSQADIYREVRRLVDSLGSLQGGLIGYVEEYQSIGMSLDNYQACVRAFQELGQYTGRNADQVSQLN